MIIDRITTELFKKEFETRGSLPSLFECSDNQEYIVKHSQQRTNFKHLINELIAAQLAQIINVNTPNFALIEINSSIIPAKNIFAAGKPAGLGFGSQFLPGNIMLIPKIETLINLISSKNADILEDLIKICGMP